MDILLVSLFNYTPPTPPFHLPPFSVGNVQAGRAAGGFLVYKAEGAATAQPRNHFAFLRCFI